MSEQSAERALGGVFCPVVTTFRDDETIDREAFLANVHAHLADGVHGIVVGGSSGEAALLDEDERGDLVAWARDAVPRERWLVAGCGGESTRAAPSSCWPHTTPGVGVSTRRWAVWAGARLRRTRWSETPRPKK